VQALRGVGDIQHTYYTTHGGETPERPTRHLVAHRASHLKFPTGKGLRRTACRPLEALVGGEASARLIHCIHST
jgi:hypothetical protein